MKWLHTLPRYTDAEAIAATRVQLIKPALWTVSNQSDVAFTSKDADDIAAAPPNAVGIIILVAVRDDGALGARCYMSFRKDNGDTYSQNVDCSPANTRWIETMVMVRLGTGNTFEYKIEASGANTFDAYNLLVGWIIG